MDLNKLYKEIEEAEVNLNAKRLKYIKEALTENGGSVKLKFKEFKEWQEANNVFDFVRLFNTVSVYGLIFGSIKQNNFIMLENDIMQIKVGGITYI